jgi:nitrite reductase/ring-hydroxylating ferredoxin subunit
VAAFVRLIELERCRTDGGTFVPCGGRELAVFRTDDAPHVIVVDNACPHASGNLSGGDVADGVVSCPWHHWQFDLRSGQCVDTPNARLTRYAAEIRDGVIYIDLDGAA